MVDVSDIDGHSLQNSTIALEGRVIGGPLGAHSTNREELVRAHYLLGKLYYDKSDLILARENFVKALTLVERPRDIFTIFKILGFLIRIASECLDEKSAEKYILESEALVTDIHKYLGSLSAEYFYNVGIVKNYRGNFGEAKENFEISFSKAREENAPEIQSKALYSLATSYFQTKDFNAALRYLHRLFELLRILDKNYMLGAMHLLRGSIYTEMEDYENALVEYREANKALKHKTCWNLYGHILLGKGVVYKRMGEFNKSMLFLDMAQDSIDAHVFRRLSQLVLGEINDVNDSTVDLYLDRTNRVVHEKTLGSIDFKHRFVLLEILFLLARNSGTSYSKEDLARSIWKDEYNPLIHDKLIYTSVSRLRKLIEPTGEKRKYILRGKDGYTFNSLVKTRFQRGSDIEYSPAIANVELTSPV